MWLNRLLRLRVPFGFLFAAWYLWTVWLAPPEDLALCAGVVLIGCALRAWAAGYLLKGKRVAVGGPYAYVRNPLYLGSFIIGCGFCLALYQKPLPVAVVVLWVIFLAGFLFIYMAKSQAEEAELTHSLGPDYETYRRQVPAILPVRGRVNGLGVQHFSLELYRRNREYQCAWGSLAVLAFLLWRTAYAS